MFRYIVLCFDDIVLCFNNTVLCFDNIVMCFDNTVSCFDNSLLCSDNTMLCLEKCLLCFKNCLLCLQIWATVITSKYILLLFQLTDKRRVSVRDFRGKLYVDIREFYEKDGEYLPGKKGKYR